MKGRQNAAEVERIGLRLQLRKQQAEAGDIILLHGDESEALTHPYLARAWAKTGVNAGEKMHRRAGAKIHRRRTPEGPRGGLLALRLDSAAKGVAEALVRGAGLLGRRSVPAEPAGWVDRLEIGEIEVTDRLQRGGQCAVLQVGRQHLQPGGIMCL